MDIVFGTKWFEKYQGRLLWLLNTPIIRVWFRYVMRIHKYDCDTFINRITPNSIFYNVKVIGEKLEITTDFRTHDKYSKRLYYAFKPFWYLLHAFDWVALDRVEALTKLSFGFSTLTQYPGSIGTNNPVDGRLDRYSPNQTWASLQGGVGTNSSDTVQDGAYVDIESGSSSNGWNTMMRSIFLFDTSALTSSATISVTVMSLRGTQKYDGATAITPNINIYTSTPASNTALVSADFTQVGTTAQCDTAITYAGFSTAGYNDFTFNATGIGNVSKTSISKFGARNANYDVANSTPTWTASREHSMYGYYSDQTGTTNDPKIVVTYTVPAGPANLKTYNTNATANINTIDTNAIANVKTLDTNV